MSFASSARRLAGLSARLLGWRPADFWAATPDELETALVDEAVADGAAPSRDEVAALMALHPDMKDMGDGR